MAAPTIGDVIRAENKSLVSAMERDGMMRCGTLGNASDECVSSHCARYIWLGGFDRFAKVASTTADYG